VNPEDAAAARFRPIAKAREGIAKAEQAHAAALVRLDELRCQLPPAERRDRERLGDALVAGKSEPSSEAEEIRAETGRQELRVEALGLAAERARGQVPELVDTNRAAWRRQAMRDLGRESKRYEVAICELQAAREALVDVATLIGWLDSGEMGEASTDLALDRMLAELRLDCEQLAAHPGTRRGAEPEPHVDIGRMRDGAAAASLWAGR
jgi:hypothetical protein